MNILELDSYNLGDAVKFNDKLNPRIWQGNKMRPEVREKLLAIAEDFKEFLGLSDLDVKDITVSGSNAGYSYTPQSDIDLHLVVDIPQADADEVYRELFDAKKYQYNDLHDITIGGYEVELYVENANKPPVSQGMFSVLNDDWINIPRQRRATVNDDAVRSKYEDLKHRIDSAVKSNNGETVTRLANKIKNMRQAGLDAHGELGPENLAYKMLRTQGYIQKLYDARNAARDQELSLKERRQPHSVFTYGFKHEEARPVVEQQTTVDIPQLSDEEILKDFINFCVAELKIEQMPTIKLRRDPQWSVVNKTFGRYIDDQHLLEVAFGQRHIMDVLRTVAHELTHKHQHERESVPTDAGETGSPYENEANARAGILMRDYGRLHPELFDAGQAHGLKESWKFKSCTLSSIELSNVLQKYYKTIFEQTGNRWYPHRCSNLAQFVIKSQRNLIKENADLSVLFKFQQSLKNIDRRNLVDLHPGKSVAIIQVIPHTTDGVIELNGFKIPKKIKNIFTEENGDIKYVEFNDGSTYPDQHFIKAGKGGGELEGINTLFFPTQQQAEQAVTMIGYKVPDQWQLSTINIDESLVKEGASGYIPTKAQAKDPRFSMALTQDIKPGQLGKEANKLKLKTDKQGHPQIANANGLFEKLALELNQFKKKKVFTVKDFKIDAFESINDYRRWQQGPKTSSRGITRYHADRYAGIFVDATLVESTNTFAQRKAESVKFSQNFKQLDNRENVKIAVGNSISLLSSIVVPGDDTHDSRIELSGFVTPKKVVKINLDNDDKIDTLEFSDGSRFPESAEFTTVGGNNITNTILFSNPVAAKKAFSQVWMLMAAMEGQGWKVEKHLSGEFKKESTLAESTEQLDEVKMSPSALQQWANSDAAKGIRAGFEAEMIFRDTNSGDDDDSDMEPDYDMDERCRSIDQVVEFFQDDEYGYGLSERNARQLQESLDEKYMEWMDEQMYDSWRDERDDLIKEAWLREKPMSERIHAALVDGLELDDRQADAVEQLASDREAGKIKGSDMTEEQLEMISQYSEARQIAEDILQEDVEQTIEKEDGFYDEVLDDFRSDFYVDDDSGFFSDVGLRYMSDVANEYDIGWPYLTGGAGNGGSRDWEEIGDSLHAAIDMPVKVSSGYHSATRKEGLWIVEPDSSLQPDDREDYGLEIVSPPMPLEQALEKLEQVCDWANDPSEGNCYTNDSTGLHMGVSVPFKGGDVDYLKLVLFLGDEYVLEQFGRAANTYTKSAMSKFKENIKGGRTDPMSVIKLMQHGLLELAQREVQKGVGEGKYTSVHVQKGYIEFRSAGGDWLAEENADPEKLSSTMLRYARAMSLAANPGEERREYAKKLYKLIAPEGDSQLALFSQFASGELTAEQLKKKWAEKTIGTEKKMNQRFRLYQNLDGRWEPVPGADWNGYPESEVKNKIWAKYGREALDSGEYQLVNMGEQDWEVYDVNTGKTLEIVKGKSKGEVADAVYDKYVNQGIGFQVRPYEDPATLTPRAKLAKSIVSKPAGPQVYTYYKWNVANPTNGENSTDYMTRERVFQATKQVEKENPRAGKYTNTILGGGSAELTTSEQLRDIDKMTFDFRVKGSNEVIEQKTYDRATDNVDGYSSPVVIAIERANALAKQLGKPVVAYEVAPAQEPEQTVDTYRGKWEFFYAPTGRVLDAVDDASIMQARAVLADTQRRYNDLPADQIQMRKAGAVQDVEPDVAQNFAAPQDATQRVGSWAIYDVTLGREISRMDNVPWSQADARANELERSTGHNMSVRGLQENFADGKGPGRPGDSQRHGIPKGATIAQLEKAAKAPGRKGQLARWQLNMRRGKKK